LKRYNIICLAHNGLELLLLVLVILTRGVIAEPMRILQTVGFLLFAVGLFLLIYSGVHLRRATRNLTLTKEDALAKSGPYRIVRHPYYLGDIILILGAAIGFRSVWGIVGTLFLLIPSAIYVARLEDEALAGKFGEDWERYADQTNFMFPLLY
jgi:protein-S-isoprenylcysteine O-methyltransferase Ste14